jgi:hypothetical protein
MRLCTLESRAAQCGDQRSGRRWHTKAERGRSTHSARKLCVCVCVCVCLRKCACGEIKRREIGASHHRERYLAGQCDCGLPPAQQKKLCGGRARARKEGGESSLTPVSRNPKTSPHPEQMQEVCAGARALRTLPHVLGTSGYVLAKHLTQLLSKRSSETPLLPHCPSLVQGSGLGGVRWRKKHGVLDGGACLPACQPSSSDDDTHNDG